MCPVIRRRMYIRAFAFVKTYSIQTFSQESNEFVFHRYWLIEGSRISSNIPSNSVTFFALAFFEPWVCNGWDYIDSMIHEEFAYYFGKLAFRVGIF